MTAKRTTQKAMTEQQFQKLNERFDAMEKRMITKSDLFQAVFTVHGFTLALIVGVIVTLNSFDVFDKLAN